MAGCCQTYTIDPSPSCACQLNIIAPNGNIVALNLSNAVVYPLTGGGGFVIQTANGGAKVSDASNFTLEDVEALICACSSVSGGGVPDPATAGTVAPYLLSTSAGGSTTAGRAQISIANVGGSSGTVGGQAFPAGAVVTYTAYLDPVSNIFYRIQAYAYDATGTTFLISETP